MYARCPSVADCGVFYYRQYLALEEAKKNKEIDYVCQEFSFGEITGDKRVEPTMADFNKHGKWADLLYYARNDVPQYIAEAGGLGNICSKTIRSIHH